jgi:hypothetical protein
MGYWVGNICTGHDWRAESMVISLAMSDHGYDLVVILVSPEHYCQCWSFSPGLITLVSNNHSSHSCHRHHGNHSHSMVINDYWAMFALWKGDGLICVDLFMSQYIFQFWFSRHNKTKYNSIYRNGLHMKQVYDVKYLFVINAKKKREHEANVKLPVIYKKQKLCVH